MDLLSVSEAGIPPADQCQQQVQRVLKSSVFRNASTLQQLLQFLTARVLAGDSEAIKEYTIGVEAFGRQQDFDPKTDTIVRVQIHRLRQKLAEYYDADGSRDPIFIDLPKGHYLPKFEFANRRTKGSGLDATPEPEPLNASASHAAVPYDDNLAAERKKSVTPPSFFRRGGIAIASAILVFVSGFWFGDMRWRNHAGGETASASSASGYGKSSDAARAFWAQFLGNDSAPVIAYPDAVFLLDNSNDLFRYRRGASDDRGARVDPHLAREFASDPDLVAQAGQLYYENGYTGAGELQGLAMLSTLFGQMGIKATVKPSRDVTPDDLRQHNVILLGSSFQNIAVAQLMTSGDFRFENPDSRLEAWRAEIVNSHPGANEAHDYKTERDPDTGALKTDYCLISIQPGVVPGRFIAILAGLDTTGTEGALMFATSKTGMEELASTLASKGYDAKSAPPEFQALLRVRLDKGYDVLESSLVSVHKFPAGNALGGEAASSPGTAP